MKVVVSAAITWIRVTGPFFVGERGLKINGNLNLEHLQNKTNIS